MRHLPRVMLMLGAMIAAAGTANASEFYKGKTITYIVATSPGGGYDTYARLIAKYLGKHLDATVRVQNVPGGGHIKGTNLLAASPRDGLTIGTFNTGLIYAQLLQREGVTFDLLEFEWIGKASADPRALVLGTKSGYRNLDDLVRAGKPATFATSGVGSASYTETQLLREALDLNIEVVPGFNGEEGEEAMLRGEIAGQLGSLSSLQTFVNNGHGTFALAVGGYTPTILQAEHIAATSKAKAIVSLVQAMSVLGRLTAAPPGTPAQRVADLRAAYERALTDPALLAEAERLGIPIEPAWGDEVAAVVRDALNQGPGTVEIIAAALNAEVMLRKVRTSLADVSPDGKKIAFDADGTRINAKVSGSRTRITIGGGEATREQLKAGMVCDIAYDPTHEDNEPKNMACEG